MCERHSPIQITECLSCGQVCRISVLTAGQSAECPRCRSVLARFEWFGPRESLALCLSALVAFILANAFPLLTLEAQGMLRQTSLPEAVSVTWQYPGMWSVALMCLITAFLVPLLHVLLLLTSLLMLQRPAVPNAFSQVTRWLHWCSPWSMAPVFLLGVLVSIIKMAGMARIITGTGLWSMAFFCLLMTLLSRIDAHTLWRWAGMKSGKAARGQRTSARRQIVCGVCRLVQDEILKHDSEPPADRRCRQCSGALHVRKSSSISRTWALMITGMLFYIPANVMPIMETHTLLNSSAHTILGGIVELWRGGAVDIAIVVFIASIAVPLVKFGALLMLLLTAGQNGTSGQNMDMKTLRDRQAKTRLYHFIEFIGQWSMLDVFVVLLLASMVNFKGFAEVNAGMGAIAFGLTVTLTMLATMSFDTRLLWDEQQCGNRDPHRTGLRASLKAMRLKRF
ncbi:paraquat-inducible membrane protein A [Pectobacterium carotovorum subsp. carotovorum]|nr:paraquat-inducible membrane protein A [Pectobacterium carotovorum subsp. carotovorum]